MVDNIPEKVKEKGLLHEQQPLFFCQQSTVNCQRPMEINFCKLILKQHKP